MDVRMRRFRAVEISLLIWIVNVFPKNDLARAASQRCDEVLASPLPYSAFSSSSVLAPDFGAGYAKLNRRVGNGGWSPLDSDEYRWLQVDLRGRKQITAIATQGRYSSTDWTKQYRLLYSDTATNWKPYRQDGNIWTFSGNWNSERVVRHELQYTIVARYLRIIPLEWSAEGRVGLRVEVYGCAYWADVIGFDGQGVISYRFRQKKMKILKDVISLRFKTSKGDGLLLHGEGQQGDYLSLELRRAKLLLQINLGSNQYGSIQGHTSVSSGSLLDDDHWHAVRIQRYRRSVNFTLDEHTQSFRTNGEFDHLDLDYEISFGGMPASAKPSSGAPQNFIGCMEDIHYNGDNITNLARRKRVDTSSFRNLTYTCGSSPTFPAFFNSSSTLQLKGRVDADTVDVSLQFRTWSPSGLLMFTALMPGGVEISLVEGKVVVHIYISQGKNTRVDISSGSGLNDGQWHSVRFLALETFAMLTINGDEMSSVRTTLPIQIRAEGEYYFGGYFPRTDLSPSQRSFHGCMQLIHVDEKLMDLHAVEQGILGSFENVSLDMCAIIDRCVPNPCEHGGRCSQTADVFKCSCDGTGYTGATCYTPIYEQSCEEYKHLGRRSDSYWIDPDGSGPLEPFKVTCNMTGDKVWMMLTNNLPFEIRVTSASAPEQGTVLKLGYNVSTEQINIITSNAEHCEQYIAYKCQKSRLLNSPDGPPYTWWVGRGNEKHFYWGGSGPGIQKCACGIERNCTDPNFYCNCDADQRHWSFWLPLISPLIFLVLFFMFVCFSETGQVDSVLIERYNTPGFVGCLSSVQFNRIAPLKAALRPNAPSTASVQGVLVESNCGALPLTIPAMSVTFDPWQPHSAGIQFPFDDEGVNRDGVNRDSAIIGGIIAVVIFSILCTLVFLVRHMFHHKGSYHTNEAKGAESADCADAAIIVNDPAFTETIDESKKEWFI
ncbi:contactin-associated protein-like 2b [Tachysurus fulvidraco]|uniref:contactin-associated protein-like 2b n=1 Tax=Tachysurus fulvidraco TaxID=1234273 RepID=UPI001FEDB2FA|nr:contactin-associated protein-like 2b [Tachysurus fulvidraco]